VPGQRERRRAASATIVSADHRSFLRLLLPLNYPFAMRVAMEHILGKSERKIWVQTFGSSITPSLMPYAAGIKVNALLLPPLVPRTPSSLSHTSVFGGFNNFEHKLRPH
jgi:hypothetical protein